MKQNIIISCFILSIKLTFLKAVIVTTLNGPVLGRTAANSNNRTFYAFQGIPFAKPPLGDLRFEAPEEPDNWNDVLDVRNKSVVCIQIFDKLEANEKEDCLILNIYTPYIPFGKPIPLLPVLVWYHGGGFLKGNATFDSTGPHFLMDHGVILVTVNYRLGAFGFLSTEDTIMPGNNGLRDTQLGLKWVHKNIKRFGGDPSKITIFGLSAGAKALGFLMLDKNSKGLFRAAIFESGTPILAGTLSKKARETAYQTANLINASININNTSSEDLLRFFKRTPSLKLKMAANKYFVTSGRHNRGILSGFPYSVVIEPKHAKAYVTRNMFKDFKYGNFIKVPIMIGTTSEEMLEHATEEEIQLAQFIKTWDEFPEELVPNDMNIKNLKTKQHVGKIIKSMYVGNGMFRNDPGAAIRYMSDTGYSRAILKHAQLQAKFTDVYVYKFSYYGVMGGINIFVPGTNKVAHGYEKNYILKNMDFIRGVGKFQDLDILISKRVLTLWTNFAKYLNPTPEKQSILNNQIWPKLSSLDSENITFLHINRTITVQQNPKETYAQWTDIYNRYGIPPFITY